MKPNVKNHGGLSIAAALAVLLVCFSGCAFRNADLTTEIPEAGTIAYHFVDFPFTAGACTMAEARLMVEHLGATSIETYETSTTGTFPTGWRISVGIYTYTEDYIYTIDYWDTADYEGTEGSLFFSKLSSPP